MRWILTIMLALVTIGVNGQEEIGNVWERIWPTEVGIDESTLTDMFIAINEAGFDVHHLTVIVDGKLIEDISYYPFQNTPHNLHSATKVVISTLIGVAIEEGYIDGVGQSMLDFFPAYDDADREEKAAITLEDLLTMRTGLHCSNAYPTPTLFEMIESANWVDFMLTRRVLDPPGEDWRYCNGATHLLSAIITQATGLSMEDYARQSLFEPLGIVGYEWPQDPQGITVGYGDLHLEPTDAAKIGWLYLNGGRWNGEQIVAEGWVEQATTPHHTFENGFGYGYQWWVGPAGFYQANGFGGQMINVFPAGNLVIVINASLDADTIPQLEQILFETLGVNSIDRSEPRPYPEDAGITQLEFLRMEAQSPQAPQPPAERPMTALSLHDRTYDLEANSFGWEAITWRFPQDTADEAALLVQIDGEMHEMLIGLDGVYRQYLAGEPVALKGEWRNPSLFLLRLQSLRDVGPDLVQFRFDDLREIEIIIADELTLSSEMFNGVRRE